MRAYIADLLHLVNAGIGFVDASAARGDSHHGCRQGGRHDCQLVVMCAFFSAQRRAD
jgi:hypothetical protein